MVQPLKFRARYMTHRTRRGKLLVDVRDRFITSLGRRKKCATHDEQTLGLSGPASRLKPSNNIYIYIYVPCSTRFASTDITNSPHLLAWTEVATSSTPDNNTPRVEFLPGLETNAPEKQRSRLLSRKDPKYAES